MKILHVLKSNIYSGAEHVVCTIIKNMPEEYECVYVSPTGAIDERLKEEAITHFCLEKFSVREVRRAINELQPDVVHAHDFTASVICALACKGEKIISHLHNNPPWIKSINIKTLLYSHATKSMTTILVVSEAVKEEYVFSNRYDTSIEVIGNPFSVEEIRKKAYSDTKKSKKSDVLFVGRLTDQKDPLIFLQIIKEYVEKHDDIKALMIGDGELREECEHFIQNNGLDEIVFLVGFNDNPYKYMANTKVLCMPSKWEGFGLVALEAMALGVPVVCSGKGGLKDIVNEDCGCVGNEIDKYSKAISSLLNDNVLYKQKSIGAIERAKEFDNIDEYKTKVISFYE